MIWKRSSFSFCSVLIQWVRVSLSLRSREQQERLNGSETNTGLKKCERSEAWSDDIEGLETQRGTCLQAVYVHLITSTCRNHNTATAFGFNCAQVHRGTADLDRSDPAEACLDQRFFGRVHQWYLFLCDIFISGFLILFDKSWNDASLKEMLHVRSDADHIRDFSFCSVTMSIYC